MLKRLTSPVLLLFTVLSLLFLVPPAEAAHRPHPPGRIIVKLPPGYITVKKELFFHKGIYYRRVPKGFRIVTPPAGLIVSKLPVGHVTVTIGGLNYFYYKNVYYRPATNGYIVVEKPAEPAPDRPDKPVELVEVGDKVAVFVDLLNLRSGPEKKHPVQQTLRKGIELTVKEIEPDWYFVELADGTTGWVMSRHTRRLLSPAQG